MTSHPVFQELVEFIFIDGPFEVLPKVVQKNQNQQQKRRLKTKKTSLESSHFRAWWRATPAEDYHMNYTQLQADQDELVQYLDGKLEEIGPLDGILGFSQGASLASWLCTKQVLHIREAIFPCFPSLLFLALT